MARGRLAFVCRALPAGLTVSRLVLERDLSRAGLPTITIFVRALPRWASVRGLDFALREDLSLQLRYSLYQAVNHAAHRASTTVTTLRDRHFFSRRRPISIRFWVALIPTGKCPGRSAFRAVCPTVSSSLPVSGRELAKRPDMDFRR